MPAGFAADDAIVTLHRTSRAPHVRTRVLVCLLGAALTALLLAPGLANALVIKVATGAGTSTVGVQPTSKAFPLDGDGLGGGGAPDAASFNNPGGNPVMHSVDSYVIYWDPSGDLYHGEWQALIDRYMSDLSGASETGANDVFSVDTQYTDRTGNAAGGSRFLGAYTDTNAYPAAGCTDEYLAMPPEVTCVDDAQIREQLHTFIKQHGLQTGMGTIFFLLTPPGVGVCVDEGPSATHCSQDNEAVTAGGFCSYHSYYPDPQYGTVLYAAIPWTAGDSGGLFGGTAGIACQDGGWNVNAEKGGPLKQQNVPQEPNQLSERGPDGLWDEGLADLTIGQIASEQQNTITDPLLDAWQDKETKSGEEIGYEDTDECRNFFLETSEGSASKKEYTEAGNLANQSLFSGGYYLNDAFNLAAQKLSYPGVPCLPGIKLIPAFTEPPTVNTGEIIGFDGMESDITLNVGEKFSASGEEKLTYPTYTWNFGDGSPEVSGYAPGGPTGNPPTQLCEEPWQSPCAASTFHSYQYGGTYQVTLTVKDVAGNTASTERPVTVVGTPPPNTGGGSGSGSGSSGSGGVSPAASSGATGTSHTGAAAATLPAPIATAAAVSSSLKQVARSGLVVRYSVNEQVAGHFEVLLSAALAHRLGISGRTASGLPAGSPKSLVIGQALLVTTKGGRSSVRIKFSKSTAKHLRRAGKVTLTLRLTARNASSQSPLFTTVMSTVVLHH
jgi:hypothetical protein